MTHLALGDFHSAIRTIEASGKYSMGESTNPIIYAFIKAVIYSDTSEVITKMPKSQDSRLTSLAYRTQAYQLYRRHNYSDALDRCTRALEADTSIAYIYYLRAVLFHALGYEADSRKAKEEACKQEEWDACSNDMVILLHQELVP
jgi:tetratricopeptide (TPR) repeat protein